MSLAPGEKVGPYEVISQLGEGGMGEVYRANDKRLHRSVALKLIGLTGTNGDRLRRFEQEARSIAALNHPNIVAIYDVGTHREVPFLVTELLEGETLRERLNRGQIPVRKTIEIATQIAQALSAAHERGIVHRDLKPENIYLTKDGHTKLLDFGLAKDQAAFAAGVTVDGSQTTPGTVMGTVGYMSPEQVRGMPADHRSDIFSFGTVLYEMLSGKRAFTAGSSVETMHAILNEEPPEIDIPTARIPPGLERIVRHCLEKNPADRFQSARDLSFALAALSGSETSLVVPLQATRARRRWRYWAIGGAALLLALLIGFALLRPASPEPAVRMEFSVPAQGEVSQQAISSDGTMLAYISPCETGEYAIFVQRVGSMQALKLAGTEGASFPFFSPDDQYIGFFAAGQLKKIPVTGGNPVALANVLSARGGSWGSRNVIIYTPDASGVMWRVDADGSNARPLTDKIFNPGEDSHRWPLFLPDGNNFLFWSGNFDERKKDPSTGIYVSDLEGKEKKQVVACRSSVGYAEQNVFYVDVKGSLVAAAYQPGSSSIAGKPRVVAEQVGVNPSTYWAAFSVAQNGTLIYHLGVGAPLSQLTWIDRNGKELGKIGEPAVIANPQISPDQARIAFDVANRREKNIDVWTYNLQNNTSARFTFDPSEETTGVWSRDGKMIAFRGIGNSQVLRLKPSNGLLPDKGVGTMPGDGSDIMPNSWSLDDRSLLTTVEWKKGGSSLILVSVSDGAMTPFLEGGAKRNGQISPDGKWVAYESNETGNWEVFITTYPTAGGKLQVSRTGGRQPRWRGDGKEIFYVDPHGMLTAVPVDTEPGLSTGTPVQLFATNSRPYISSTDLFTYDVNREGTRFIVDRYYRPANVPPLNIVLNSLAGR
jgi:serine/threonine protein kinase/Tol biopolymer transport system component